MCEYRHKMVVLLRDGHMVLARRNLSLSATYWYGEQTAL